MSLDIFTHLSNGPVQLHLDSIIPAPSQGELVPFMHFTVLAQDSQPVGHINFRIGNTRHILLCAGHIGYGILPEHRGSGFAYHACLALAPVVRSFYPTVILTVDPANTPSIHIIEKLGAASLGTADVPPDDPAYQSGARHKLRYEWTP